MSADETPTTYRRAGRRATDPAVMSGGTPTPVAGQTSPGVNLPVPVGRAYTHQQAKPAGPVEAQMLGQAGQKRGLRGGKPVLDQARGAYLGAEWSGSADRRPKSGIITKTDI